MLAIALIFFFGVMFVTQPAKKKHTINCAGSFMKKLYNCVGRGNHFPLRARVL